MRQLLIDTANRLHYYHCDCCGTRTKGWKPVFSFEVPLCERCIDRIAVVSLDDLNDERWSDDLDDPALGEDWCLYWCHDCDRDFTDLAPGPDEVGRSSCPWCHGTNTELEQ